jgi:hypothetical protein
MFQRKANVPKCMRPDISFFNAVINNIGLVKMKMQEIMMVMLGQDGHEFDSKHLLP